MTQINESISPQLVLASRSPRRKELLAQMGLNFHAASVLVEEIPLPGEEPADYVIRVAKDKALAGWRLEGENLDLPVLGSDTAVVVDGEILGKPQDAEDSVRMLSLLSGKTHQVYTSIVCVYDDELESDLVVTEVTFAEIDAELMARYWQTGEPVDKAGSYAIQGFGALFVRKISGSYTGVVGLPVYETNRLLSNFGVDAL